MRRLLGSTALALMVAGPVMAQQATTTESTAPADQTTIVGVLFLPAEPQDPIYGSDLMGMDVYSSETDYSADYGSGTAVTADARGAWDSIGEVSDLVMTQQGDVQGILVDVGGFLGMGEHTVALDLKQVHFLQDEGGEHFIAVRSTREELESAPEFQRQDDTMASTQAPASGMAAAPATPGAEANTPGMMSPGMRPAYEREGWSDADYSTLTAEQLQGASIYDANDENVGEIGELILAQDGRIEQAIVDVGGFLGIGEHSVALPFDELQIMTNADQTAVRVYIDDTREELEQRPAYQS